MLMRLSLLITRWGLLLFLLTTSSEDWWEEGGTNRCSLNDCPLGDLGRLAASVTRVTSVCQTSWAPCLPVSLGSLLGVLLASYLARERWSPWCREKGRGTWSTREHLELGALWERSHPSLCPTHLSPFPESKIRKHTLRCLIHSK